MPPTLKDSSTPTPSAQHAERSTTDSAAREEGNGAQPVALEVPVTVNGARAVEGSQKREPFSETTSTVLVLVNGAVIRLSSSVLPGQLLFLTNEKTRKEVVCQVVKSKNHRSASGYVELEFTEPVLGFWGMRFPGERPTVANSSAPAVSARKLDVAPVIPAVTAESKPIPVKDAQAPVVGATADTFDAVEEFKTEIKADSRPSSKADFLAPAETSSEGLKLQTNRLQEQLSALLFSERRESESNPAAPVVPPSKKELEEVAGKIFEIANEAPAEKKDRPLVTEIEARLDEQEARKGTPAAAMSSFDDEVVKIPAWLEPLARNAAIPAPPAHEQENDIGGAYEGSQGSKTVGEPISSPQQQTVATTSAAMMPAAPARQSTGPLFGRTLLDQSSAGLDKTRGNGKGVWMWIAAVVIGGAAIGGWYFRDSLTGLLPGHAATEAPASMAPVQTAAAPGNSTALSGTSSTADHVVPGSKTEYSSAKTEAAPAVVAPEQGKVQAAAMMERLPKADSSNDVIKAPKAAEETQPESKRLALGEVRLAKPKVTHASKAQANGEIEPALDSQPFVGGDSSLGTDIAEGAKQPVAPAEPVRSGGDVKAARMLSSVPPIYPMLAKSQHISGDVRVDALIDASGKVTTMKVISGPSLLHQAAMDALRQWKYQPASLDGKPVPMHLTVTIQFRLQ